MTEHTHVIAQLERSRAQFRKDAVLLAVQISALILLLVLINLDKFPVKAVLFLGIISFAVAAVIVVIRLTQNWSAMRKASESKLSENEKGPGAN